MRRATPLLSVLLLALGAAEAPAASREGVTLPDRLEVGGQDLVLNGLGIREATMFNVNVYVAGLYVKEKTSNPADVIDPKAPKRILMHFVRDVDASDVRGAYEEGFEKNAGKAYASMKANVKKLNGWMSDMKKGQRMAITYVPGEGTSVSVQGKTKGTIPGEDFGKVMFTIFFGPKPPNSDLKEGMLGKRK